MVQPISSLPFHGGVFAAQLESDCAELRLPLTTDQIDLLLNYLAQMIKWNKTYNLTAIRSPEQMLLHHIVDSLAIIPEFAARLAASSARILDVGSGAGLPGIVLAIVRPDWEVSCIDAVEKKVAFIRQMASVLKLPNLKAIHGRVEAEQDASYDVVTSRAFASLQDFAALSGRLVKDQGILVAMKGMTPEDEIEALKDQGVWEVEEITRLMVPRLSAQRCLVWMKRKSEQSETSSIE